MEIGILGSGLGFLSSYLLVHYINELHAWLGRQFHVQIWNPEVYLFDKIPNTMNPNEVIVIVVGHQRSADGARGDDGKLQPLDVKAGDRVLFGKWSGTEVKLDGEDLIIMKESDIMGIIEATAARKAA